MTVEHLIARQDLYLKSTEEMTPENVKSFSKFSITEGTITDRLPNSTIHAEVKHVQDGVLIQMTKNGVPVFFHVCCLEEEYSSKLLNTFKKAGLPSEESPFRKSNGDIIPFPSSGRWIVSLPLSTEGLTHEEIHQACLNVFYIYDALCRAKYGEKIPSKNDLYENSGRNYDDDFLDWNDPRGEKGPPYYAVFNSIFFDVIYFFNNPSNRNINTWKFGKIEAGLFVEPEALILFLILIFKQEELIFRVPLNFFELEILQEDPEKWLNQCSYEIELRLVEENRPVKGIAAIRKVELPVILGETIRDYLEDQSNKYAKGGQVLEKIIQIENKISLADMMMQTTMYPL